GGWFPVGTRAVEYGVGFDGTTRWSTHPCGPVVGLDMAEADRDRYLFGVLCQRWLAADGGFTVEIDPKHTTALRVCVTLTHRDAGVPAKLLLSRVTWLPELLTFTAG